MDGRCERRRRSLHIRDENNLRACRRGGGRSVLAIFKSDALARGDAKSRRGQQVDSRVRLAAMDLVPACYGAEVLPDSIAGEAILNLCRRRGRGHSTWHFAMAEFAQEREDAGLQREDDAARRSLKLAPDERAHAQKR